MDNPSRTGTTYPFIAGMMYKLGGNKNGVPRGKAYFSALKKNGSRLQTSSTQTLTSLKGGSIKLGLVQNTVAIGAAAKDPTLHVVYPAPLTQVPAAIGIAAKAPTAEQAEARKFIAFVLTTYGQADMQAATKSDGSLYYPVLNGITPLKTVPPLGTVETQRITPYVWGPREASINSWFSSHIAK